MQGPRHAAGPGNKERDSPTRATPLLTKPLSTVPLLWMFTFTHSDLLLPSHAQRPPALSKLNSDTAHHKPATDKKQAAGPGFCDL